VNGCVALSTKLAKRDERIGHSVEFMKRPLNSYTMKYTPCSTRFLSFQLFFQSTLVVYNNFEVTDGSKHIQIHFLLVQ